MNACVHAFVAFDIKMLKEVNNLLRFLFRAWTEHYKHRFMHILYFRAAHIGSMDKYCGKFAHVHHLTYLSVIKSGIPLICQRVLWYCYWKRLANFNIKGVRFEPRLSYFNRKILKQFCSSFYSILHKLIKSKHKELITSFTMCFRFSFLAHLMIVFGAFHAYNSIFCPTLNSVFLNSYDYRKVALIWCKSYKWDPSNSSKEGSPNNLAFSEFRVW